MDSTPLHTSKDVGALSVTQSVCGQSFNLLSLVSTSASLVCFSASDYSTLRTAADAFLVLKLPANEPRTKV